MALKQNVGGTWKDIVVWVNVGGTWKIASVNQNVAGVWKTITSALSVTLSPTSLNKTRFGAGSITSNTVTATGLPSGGTYAWTYVSGDSFTITSPSTAATAFSTSLSLGQTKSGVYRCTYTYSGQTASATINCTFSETS